MQLTNMTTDTISTRHAGLSGGTQLRLTPPRRGLPSVVASLLAGGAYLMSGSAGVLYDLQSDFSTIQNPNGPWSYNQAGGPILSPITGAGIGLPYLVGWGPSLDMNRSITTVTGTPDAFWKDLAVGDVVMHTAGTEMSITWTSPGAGTIDISGAAWDAYFDSGRDASWTLLVNGAAVAAHGSVFGLLRTDAAASFANNILPARTLTGLPVSPGDMVELTTDSSAYSYGHMMGLDITLDFTAVPEPISSGGAVLALLGVVFVRRLNPRGRKGAA